MDYEAPDGSQFSLRAVWRKGSTGTPVFDYTNVTSYVDGIAYTNRLDVPPEQVDEVDLLSSMEPVPLECIHPRVQDGFTLSPTFNPLRHYLKAPSFTYEDCRPGNTFVADCLLNEVSTLERLRTQPHPNIVEYHGCVVRDGRITHICLERYPSNLINHPLEELTDAQRAKIMKGIEDGIAHLHSIGLAHNDINPGNICIDTNGDPIIIDFDSCAPFDERLIKGSACEMDGRCPTSRKENDLLGLRSIEAFFRLQSYALADADNLNDNIDRQTITEKRGCSG